LLLGAALILAAAASRSGPVPAGAARAGGKDADLRGRINKLEAEVKHLRELLPDQAAVMTHVGYHWGNLWFAIDRHNWPLAEFYLSETRNNIKWAVRTRPFRQTNGGYKVDLKAIAEALDSTQLKQMHEAITRKDRARCIKLYDEAMSGCYACHKASEKPYLRPQRPAAPEAPVVNFDPNAKEPR
jgi:hypothetical protein